MLNKDEAVALAALLEELAVGLSEHPLSAPAWQSAVLLRQRVEAAGQGSAIRSRPGDPESRRHAGGIRDDVSDDRDVLAGQRDDRADDRDDRGRERRGLTDAADQMGRIRGQRLRALLQDAELRDKAAAERASAAPPGTHDAFWQRWQAEQRLAEADRIRNADDRAAILAMLLQDDADRAAAAQDRHYNARDRLDGQRDRRSALADRRSSARDRLAAQADRDQAVIDGEVAHPS